MPKEALSGLLNTICSENNIIKHPFTVTEEIEVVRRNTDGKALYYLFNFSGKKQTISFQDKLIDCIEDKVYESEIVIGPNGLAVLREF